MNTFPWNIFYIFMAAGLIGSAAVIPYAQAMNSKATDKQKETDTNTNGDNKEKKNLPMPLLILLSILQSAIFIGLASFVGLLAAKQIGLGTQILQAVVTGQSVMGKIQLLLPITVLLGLASGIFILVLEAAYFIRRIPRQLAGMDHRMAFWKRVLACFYGGIVEEIFMRLFLMSSLAWLIGLVWKASNGTPAVGAFWLANILAALLFGAGHLPATALVTKLTPMIVVRALVLNGVPGVVCGYLYMTYGLEAAMLTHFSLDILLHLIAPSLLQRFVPSQPSNQAAQPA